mmetsp:Transcript_39520/g.92958  ORF Transcript_39520/g.92958 Transcript_39520/m.92958 type:complete len:715 (-) Transcript_39520:30-2174(-)
MTSEDDNSGSQSSSALPVSLSTAADDGNAPGGGESAALPAPRPSKSGESAGRRDPSKAGASGAPDSLAAAVAGSLPESKELEILVAEVENRIRQLVIRMIRPALTQTADISQKMEDISNLVEVHEAALHTVEKMKEEVGSVSELMAVVQKQLHTQSEQARVFETQTVADINKLRSGLYDVKAQQEEQLVSLRQLDREVARAWEETARLQTQHDEAVRKLTENTNAHTRQTERDRKEVGGRIDELQKRHEELAQELLSESSGRLCKLKADIDRTWNFVQPITELQDDVGRALQRTDELESMLKQDEEALARCRLDMASTEANFDKKYEHFAEELHSVSAKFAAHHAGLLKDFRKNCMEELTHLREAQSKLQEQEVHFEAVLGDLKVVVGDEKKRIDAMHKVMAAEMDEIQKRRKKERLSMDVDLREMKKELSQQDSVIASMSSSLEHVGKVLHLVLEGERIVSSLELQDFLDRSSEYWLRAPGGPCRRAAPAVPGVEALPHRPTADLREESVELDPRKPTLVKDKYLPGPVQHNGSIYERRDLLVLFHKLVQKAQQGLAKGPLSNSQLLNTAASITAAQPSANGGLSVGQTSPRSTVTEAASFRKGDVMGASLSESRATAALQAALITTASRQRPGSQGQPQGTGSRGGMGGPLGETEAPPGVGAGKLHAGLLQQSIPTLRLPVINDGRKAGNPASARVASTASHSKTIHPKTAR